jgi:glycine cleavage system H protein
MPYPAHYRYTKEHEWIDATDGRIGITEHAQETLGDIVFVELPQPGATIAKGATFGSVESVKAVSDLYAPVSGEVTAVNVELAQAPEQINADAHAAWIMQVKIADAGELDGLLSAEDYEAFVAAEK